MEHGVHIPLFVQGVEDGTRDVGYSLSNNPDEGSGRYRIYQGLESYQHTKAHTHKTERLDIGVFFQSDKADDGSHNGTQPNKAEQRPTPIALSAQGYQRQWQHGPTYGVAPSTSNDVAMRDR